MTLCGMREGGFGGRWKGIFGSFPCIKNYDFKLDVAKRFFLGKKCVCDIGEKGGEYGSRMYSYHYNGKWLKDLNVFCVNLLN